MTPDDDLQALENQPDFPRFNSASTALRDAEGRLLQALRGSNRQDIVAAKVALMGALDAYGKEADALGGDVG